ncbi:winged helix-turn-helix domain-containing protein [Actinoplanes sp. LDG1-06]|uniref:Winged helix-turn-helix domain-containing protein n=1 Tax=Paractinoplanes ovalisporus TaxID=2810368 RepID=A0ABS2AM47_9ACTN|nr:BTAD domain-containing putative transcriptional regulator [Actinoplanes ovalisporus]MBM2620906.1 winged helix-turn-helix domain-containing protein [Actinoplanes ovalisporus]
MRVEVGLLGPIELRRDDRPAALPGAPQRALLARLALAGGRVVPTGDLLDLLWGDDPPGNATGNLHSYVSRLRRHTGADAIRREPGGYRLDLPVDVQRVERMAAAARDQPPERAAETFAAALRVWRGDPLADVADRLAFAPDVARLTEWRHHLREECLDRRISAGHAAGALPEIEEYATAEPLRERVHLLHMRALHQAGRTAEALGVARAYRERVVDGHGVDPSPALDELRGRILAEDPALRPGVTAPPPRRPDRFFGRHDEMAALRAALAGGRLTTLVGPGGVGKTRLMTEALNGGELVVELAERSVPDDVATAVAGALGLRAAPRGGAAAIASRLGSAPALLVLDNCEHLLDAVREMVEEILLRCPRVRVLATSRQRLGATGERVLRLGPLPEADRVALFCDRAALLRADFGDDDRTRALAAEVCGLVDGLPLAVELAARRESVFGLPHLRDRLHAGLHVLEPARGGDRSTAVTATVEWSYRLLDPDAQRLLDRLAVCRGGFGLDILAYLAAGENLLAELVDASLITCDLGATPPRYRLLETVRHVALAHLGPEDERAARDAHARWMLDFVTDLLRRQRVRNPDTTPALRRELANLQEALAWLADRDEGARLAAWLAAAGSDAPDPGLTAQLVRFAPERVETEADVLRALAAGTGQWLDGRLAEADRLLSAAIDRLPEGHPLGGAALLGRISTSMFAGDADRVRADASRLRADRAAPAWTRSTGLCCAALMDAYGGDAAAGLRRLEAYGTELTADPLDGFVPFTRAELLAGIDPVAALGFYDESLRRTERAGLGYTANIARVGRAALLIRTGRHDEAIGACADTIVRVRAAGMTAQLWTVLRLTAELLAGLGDPDTAAVIVAAADADPYAPAVMGPDVERLARLRAPDPPPQDVERLARLRAPDPPPQPEDVVETALERLRQAASKVVASAGPHRTGHD